MEPDQLGLELGRRLKVHLSILALEVCLPYDAALHDELRSRLAWRPPRATPGEKWKVYNGIFQLLSNAVPHLHRGCWDYFDNDETARRGFADWSRTLKGGIGPRASPSGDGDPYRGVQTYMTATAAFQIRRDSACDRELRAVCSIPEDRLWSRATFARILARLGTVNFDQVQADVAYVIPRDSTWALTQQDLAAPTFNYLRVVTD